MMPSAKELLWLTVLIIIMKELHLVLFEGGSYDLNHSVNSFIA